MKMGESAKDRRLLVREAGFKPTSLISVVAGTLAAFGLLAVAMAVAAAVVAAIGIDTNTFTNHEWRRAGIAGASIGVVIVFGAFLLGGYTAGRMSRRMGFRHGALVFLCAAMIIAVVTALATVTDAWTDLRHHLAANDIPTGSGTWSDIGIAAGIASAAATLLGSMLGGIAGDRWHTRLTSTAAERRARAEEAHAEDERWERPRHALGEDETSIDLRDRTEAMTPSLEEERENERAGRADVGM
jgi:hypothetical protein